jgi:hypothetical protein
MRNARHITHEKRIAAANPQTTWAAVYLRRAVHRDGTIGSQQKTITGTGLMLSWGSSPVAARIGRYSYFKETIGSTRAALRAGQ